MTPDENLAALRCIAPFDRISDDGLALLLKAVDVRRLAPGAVVTRSASPRLTIAIAGAVLDSAGAAAGPIIGLAGMFEDLASPPLIAEHSLGATLVSIDRQTFFTLARASPELVRGLLEAGPAGENKGDQLASD